MDALAARCPSEGRMLEAGCGHGLLSLEAALLHPALAVLGIDPAPDKIAAARAAAVAVPNATFRCERLEDVAERGFDAVAVPDVLYLVPRAEWPSFLGACRDRLRPGGRLLLKEVAPRPRWKFYRCLAQETLSVRLLRITLGARFAFETREAMERLLAACGFADVRFTALDRGYLTPHVLYEATRV
jgi:2-polyprenyl-3-methyl-5-hydroxy-6-metoxy-1,4-benzoquinol methylase